MRIAQEETFGPVAPITVVKDEIQVIELANNSEFGLGASIWTLDLHKAERLSRLVESGMVTVNNVVVSDPRIPFGGIKNSGFGRELSRYGMLEFANIKSVMVYDLMRATNIFDTSVEEDTGTEHYWKMQPTLVSEKYPFTTFPVK